MVSFDRVTLHITGNLAVSLMQRDDDLLAIVDCVRVAGPASGQVLSMSRAQAQQGCGGEVKPLHSVIKPPFISKNGVLPSSNA